MERDPFRPMSTQPPSRPPYDIYERSFLFACAIVRFHRELAGRNETLRVLGGQLLRAGTGVGSNLEEAKAASSRRDFVAKSAISLRECRESAYWLRVIAACGLASPDVVAPLQQEANELVAILTTIVKRSRAALTISTAARVLVVTLAFFLILNS